MERDTNSEDEITTITVPITLEIPAQRINDLLTSAFEGGSNYWAKVENNSEPRPAEYLSDVPMAGGWVRMYALDDGGKYVAPDGKKEWTLDRAAIEKGLLIMARDHGRHFGNFMAENDDAETGDVFLQCCLFGEVVFG